MNEDNEATDTNVDDIENLKTLLFQDNLTQYGKRKLIEYYENKIQELEKENQELLDVRISVSAENTIENLKRENIKLDERCFIAEGNLKTTKEELRDYFYNSIPKQKIKDKIEEFKNENYQIALDSEVAFDTGIMKNNLKIQVLEELLQESENNKILRIL